MDQTKELLIIVAAAIVIIGGGIYIYQHVDVGCVNLYFYKSCGVVTHP
jgi:uncharacterized protein YxeA